MKTAFKTFIIIGVLLSIVNIFLVLHPVILTPDSTATPERGVLVQFTGKVVAVANFDNYGIALQKGEIIRFVILVVKDNAFDKATVYKTAYRGAELSGRTLRVTGRADGNHIVAQTVEELP